jgi:ADP-heptose:LPS heptosyltransferase
LHRILVIKLGALGDFVQALGPMAAIRQHHRDARITLLTTAPYRLLAAASGYFDDIWLDPRASLVQVGALLQLRRKLRGGAFDRVYDLQTSDRSSWYYRLLGPGKRPQWSGIARGASHPHANPERDHLHTRERQREQLLMAGVPSVPDPDLSWALGTPNPVPPGPPYAILAPAASALRPGKRWPAESFTAVAKLLADRGIRSVVVGGDSDRALAATILAGSDTTVDLTGRTDLLQLARAGSEACLALGNDTGPMHLFAAVGIPSVVLFSADSDPVLTAPRGPRVSILRRASLADLSVDEVVAACPLD